ncbi:hypothetical protein NH340_JMT02886 [Sarcoptes scabiei]|nr:hypothetical protein NH340_JMT02886 [Sarcoptes scabiei]
MIIQIFQIDYRRLLSIAVLIGTASIIPRRTTATIYENTREKRKDIVSRDDEFENLDFNNLTRENIEIYFKIKRRQQLDAIGTLMNFEKYEHKYSMIYKIFDKLCKTIENSRQILTKKDPKQVDDVLNSNDPVLIKNTFHIIENCALFSNIALKLPDISKRILNEQIKWIDYFRWCSEFSTKSQLIDEISMKMFNLASQQLKIIQREDNFMNPYERKNQLLTNRLENAQIKSKTKKTTNVRKGPRMSRTEF